MGKIRFYLKKLGEITENAVKNDFVYDYDDQDMAVNSLVDFCQKIYDEVKKAIVEISSDNTDQFEVVLDYSSPADDLYLYHFVSLWLNGAKEGLDRVLRAGVLVKRIT